MHEYVFSPKIIDGRFKYEPSLISNTRGPAVVWSVRLRGVSVCWGIQKAEGSITVGKSSVHNRNRGNLEI